MKRPLRHVTPRVISFAVVAAAALGLGWQRGLLLSQSESTAVEADPSVRTLRVRFGVNDKEPAKWDGSATVTGGTIVKMRDWRPRKGDKVEASSWSLATSKGPLFVMRAWDDYPIHQPQAPILVPGLLIDVKGHSGTKLTIKTAQESVTVMPFSARVEGKGGIAVDVVPTPLEMSTADYQNDFATIAGGAGKQMWMAWVAWKPAGDEIMMREFDGARWLPRVTPLEKPGDVFIVKLGRDRNNGIWAVWSQQVEGNWDLYGRRFDGKAWAAVERLTNDPQPDIFHDVTTDSNGNLWVVWQGFRNGKSDIFARHYDGENWSEEERVSDSPANDWQPAVAADGVGRVYVGWDTYDKGNYDVRMRSWANGQWSAPVAVAQTPRFEAHVSLACDKENRLWAAWNESGFNWGKDTGFLVKLQGTRLYQWRTMSVAVWDGAKWNVPVSDINTALPADLQGYNDFPILHRAGDGRMWVFFRHRTLRIQNTASDTPAHRAEWQTYGTAYEGKSWGEPVEVPLSMSRMDTRGGIASDSAGNLWAAWPTDNRDFEEFLFKHMDVHVEKIAGAKIAGERPAPGAVLEPRPQDNPQSTRLDPEEAQNIKAVHDYEIRNNGQTYHIYRGDTHRHSEFSFDGNNDGALIQTYRYAIDAVRYDFLAHTDHNQDGGPDVPYINWLLQQMSDLMYLPGTFTPFYSYERSVPYPNGHRNILFAERGVPTLPIPQSENDGDTGAGALYAYLKKYHGIAISHTSSTGMGTDWRDNDPEVEPLVEIYQGDRISSEYEGAPKAAYAANPASQPGGFKPKGYVWNAWAKGYKLGTQAASDHLSTHISYACTISPDGTRKGLLDSMRARHSYGATDNIVLDYRLVSQGKEYLQGDIVPASGPVKLSVHVIGTVPVRQVDIICNNKFVFTGQPMQKEVNLSFTGTERGERYYYVRIQQVDDNMAWSSPIWVK